MTAGAAARRRAAVFVWISNYVSTFSDQVLFSFVDDAAQSYAADQPGSPLGAPATATTTRPITRFYGPALKVGVVGCEIGAGHVSVVGLTAVDAGVGAYRTIAAFYRGRQRFAAGGGGAVCL